MSDRDWADHLARRDVVSVETSGEDGSSSRAVPSFATSAKPVQAFAAFVEGELKAKRRVVLAGGDKDLRALSRRVREAVGLEPTVAANWAAVAAAQPGAVLALPLDLDGGFVDEEAGVTVVTAVDLFGSRARGGSEASRPCRRSPDDAEFGIGDAVIHLDRGMGVLQGLESVETEVSAAVDTIRLAYADDDTLMAPVDELDRIWRYGAGDAVALDRLDGEAWPKRRARIEGEIAETARRLVALTREREARSAPKLIAPSQRLRALRRPLPVLGNPRSAARHRRRARRPCLGTSDGPPGLRRCRLRQDRGGACAPPRPSRSPASRSRSWRRPPCWCASICRRSGAASPGSASRSGTCPAWCSPPRRRAVKAGLADGTVDIVIGTHALTGQGRRASRISASSSSTRSSASALPISASCATSRADVHVLTLTATPIPRTLQAAMLGLQDLSVIATPPAQRRPIRTIVAAVRRSHRCDRRSCASGAAAARASWSARASRTSSRWRSASPTLVPELAGPRRPRQDAGGRDRRRHGSLRRWGRATCSSPPTSSRAASTCRAPTRCWSGAPTASASRSCTSCAVASAAAACAASAI